MQVSPKFAAPFLKCLTLSFFAALSVAIASSDHDPLDRGAPAGGADEHSGHEEKPKAKPPVKPAPKPESAVKTAPPAASHGLSPEAAKAAIEAAIRRLREGNERYVTDNAGHPRQNRDRRVEVAKGQKPFAIVVTCSDSRLPPELLFDQGLGDLFVIRIAGQVLDAGALGSIEYAVEHLDVPLILVLGHERCGAVDAACKRMNPENHIRHLVEAITPAVTAAREQGGDLLERAVAANVQRGVDELRASWPVMAPRVRENRLAILGAVYDLDIGIVLFQN